MSFFHVLFHVLSLVSFVSFVSFVVSMCLFHVSLCVVFLFCVCRGGCLQTYIITKRSKLPIEEKQVTQPATKEQKTPKNH